MSIPHNFSAQVDNVSFCQHVLSAVLNGVKPIIISGASKVDSLQLMYFLRSHLPAEYEIIKPLCNHLRFTDRALLSIGLMAKQSQGPRKLLFVLENAQKLAEADLKVMLSLPRRQVEQFLSFQLIIFVNNGLTSKLDEFIKIGPMQTYALH